MFAAIRHTVQANARARAVEAQATYRRRIILTRPLTAKADGDAATATTDRQRDGLAKPKDSGISTKAEPLTEAQKQALKAQWSGYVDYMSNQRDKGWKT